MSPCAVPFDLPSSDTESAAATVAGIEIRAHMLRLPGVRPRCRQLSERVHSYYERTLMDLPVEQRHVSMLRARRNRYLAVSCDQQTCGQQMQNLFQPYCRATNRLLTGLYDIVQAVGGRH